VHQVGNYCIVNSWCTARKTLSYVISCLSNCSTEKYQVTKCSNLASPDIGDLNHCRSVQEPVSGHCIWSVRAQTKDYKQPLTITQHTRNVPQTGNRWLHAERQKVTSFSKLPTHDKAFEVYRVLEVVRTMECTGFWRWYVPWSVQGPDDMFWKLYNVCSPCITQLTQYSRHSQSAPHDTPVSHHNELFKSEKR